MSENDDDLPQLQQDVQRFLGRCILRLQQYERPIKPLVAHHRFSGPIEDLYRIIDARIASTARRTLGSLDGELVGSCDVPDDVWSREDTATGSPDSANWLDMQMTIRLSGAEFARVERDLREMVELGNNMVHHFLDQYDIFSADGCRKAQDVLVEAYNRIDRHLAQLKEWAQAIHNMRPTASEFMNTQAVKDYIANGTLPTKPYTGPPRSWRASCERLRGIG